MKLPLILILSSLFLTPAFAFNPFSHKMTVEEFEQRMEVERAYRQKQIELEKQKQKKELEQLESQCNKNNIEACYQLGLKLNHVQGDLKKPILYLKSVVIQVTGRDVKIFRKTMEMVQVLKKIKKNPMNI